MDAKKAGALAMVPTTLLGVPLFVVVLLGGGNEAERPVCDPAGAVSGPGITVDPASIPKNITVTGGWGHDQATMAATILLAAKERGADAYAQQLTLTAAMAESGLRNLNHGDAARNDTIGLFQQGPEHGSYKDRMDPTRATYIFFDRMKKRNPDLHAQQPTLILHKTQNNQDPYHYQPYWSQAGEMLKKISGAKKDDSSSSPSSSPSGSSSSSSSPSSPSSSPTDDAQTVEKDTSKWNLGPVKKHTSAVANTIGNKYKLKTIVGWRDPKVEKIEPEGHPAGNALDFMITNVPNGTETGQQIADYLTDHASELGVKHIIWRQKIWVAKNPGKGWAPMEDRGSPTANHMDHVHLSLEGDPAAIEGSGEACEGASSGATDTSKVNAKGWANPIKGAPWVSNFGPRARPAGVGSAYHRGLDFGAPCGTPIFAAHDGMIAKVRHGDPGGGSIVTLDHGDGHTRSEVMHMSRSGVLVKQGDKVKAGQQIAKVGNEGKSTGCHLHFQTLLDGKLVDPKPILDKAGVNIGPYRGT